MALSLEGWFCQGIGAGTKLGTELNKNSANIKKPSPRWYL
jgi:hypothetical protein